MAQELIAPFVVSACALLIVMAARAFAARTTHLKLTVFQPYRADPWPVGVQEDDDFRFAWSAPDSGMAVPDQTVPTAPLGRIHVGRAQDEPRRER